MKKSKVSEAKIFEILKEAEAGISIMDSKSTNIKETQDETITRLANMGAIEYGQFRKQEAKKLNIG